MSTFSQLNTAPATVDFVKSYVAEEFENVVPVGGKVIHVSKADTATDTRTGLSAYDATRPFATPAAAKAVAVSGDTIHVWPGNYTITASLAKNGVNWDFDVSTVTLVSPTVSIWDDGNTAMTFRVSGRAAFVHEAFGAYSPTNEASKTVWVRHASSRIIIECASFTTSGDGVGKLAVTVVFQAAGYLEIHCAGDISATSSSAQSAYTLWWVNGEGHIFCTNLLSNHGTIYTEVSATPTGDWYVTADYCGGFVYVTGSNSVAALWMTFRVIKDNASDQGCLQVIGDIGTGLGGTRVYLTCQKAFGAILCHSFSSLIYFRADKHTATTSGGIAGLFALGNFGNNPFSGTFYYDVTHSEPAAVTGAMMGLQGTGTTHLVRLNFVSGANALGLELVSGTVVCHDVIIDTSANSATNPITLQGTPTTLKLMANTTLISQGARKCVNVTSGTHTLRSYGAHANNTAHASVTTIVPAAGLVVDASVT